MLARQVRSGLVETEHAGAVCAVDGQGIEIASFGDVDRSFFIRSSAKPFQAFVSQECGADLSPLELAMACSSHRGQPVQIALVESMLARAGLDESYLRCPPSWPLGDPGQRLVVGAGAIEPRRIWHNCSGKHAAFLRACVANGWPTESYLHPDHPLQRRVIDYLGDVGDHEVEPVGVDGCGAPVLRTSVAAMARMYSRLAFLPSLNDVFSSMHRYPALVGNTGEGDTEVAIATNSAAKGGAAGCVGVAVRNTLGLAAKSWDGSHVVADLAAVRALDQLGILGPVARERLEAVAAPPVRGGGEPVGSLEAVFDLQTA